MKKKSDLNNSFINYDDIKRILILGHSGFIGSHLEKAFRHLSPGIEIIGRSLPDVNLTKEKEVLKLSDLFDLETAVIMCAAIKRQFSDNLDTFLENMTMAINLCRLLQKCPVKRFVFFSSVAVYGEETHNTNITEQTPVYPTSYYGLAKYISECLFTKVICQQGQNSLLILRLPLIYGPGDRGGTYGPVKFVKAALRREQITLWGDGTELREFIFIEDIVKIVHRLTFDKYDGVVNIASGKSYTFKDAIKIVSSFMPGALKIISLPRTKKKADNKFCNARLVNLLKDFYFVSLDEGIKRTFEAEGSLQYKK